MQTSRHFVSLLALLALGAVMIGCETTPKNEAKKDTLVDDSHAAINRFQREDPSLRDMMSSAYGYAVFPNIGKGGVIVGGAYGKGTVYQQGNMVGYADLTQATVGAQLGGQTFSEVILFENSDAMNHFKANELAFSANASAVAIKAGAAKSAKYNNGVAVFTMPNGGLMFEASVGGQKFTYVPANQGDRSVAADQRAATTQPSGAHIDVDVDRNK
jgi:lipid-binding SYLF domain-containing protein